MDNLPGAREVSKKEDKMFEPNDILKELQSNKHGYIDEKLINNNIKIFQKLLNFPMKITNSNNWEPVVVELIESITTNNKIRDTKILLASHVCFTIFTKIFTVSELKSTLEKFLSLQIKKLSMFNKEFNICDLESFKLTIIYGYFSVINHYSIFFSDICINSFTIIQRNCLVYSKYNYFGFYLLKMWLDKSIEMEFWKYNHPLIEKDLESIIFSSWDHSITEIAKLNALKIFPTYLNIMNNNYPGYLEYTFKICKKNLSWQSTIKFIILSEICNIWTGCPVFHNLELKIIFKSLEKHHLKHVSTKLYLALINKITENKWIELIMNELCFIAEIWEKENNISPLKILWEFWMKPTLNKFNSIIIPLLWAFFCEKNMIVCQSYLARKAGELGLSWTKLNSKNLKINSYNQFNVIQWTCSEFNSIPPIINDERDCVKVNIFAIQCHKNNSYGDINNYELIKHFLYFNTNSCSILLRKGMIDSFETLFRNSLQSLNKEDINFIIWLNYLILDCFEPGSCYQRRIIGLKLYEIILKCLKKLKNDSSLIHQMHDIVQSFYNKYHLFILLKLCLDPIDEIRNLSSNIINNYFDLKILTNEEIDTLMKKSEAMKISSKFYEICGGVKLLTLISTIPNKKNPFYHNNEFILHEKLFESANRSLDFIKNDLLKGLTHGSDFNGSLMTIKELFGNSNTLNISEIYIKKLLNFLEESAEFFISTLSPKSSQISYSPSFAEMGIAIEETIKNSDIDDEFDNQLLSPAHQIIISNIWMALKNICELAAKISITLNNFDYIKRSLDLIISVLMKCRHKGAIEAAGYALGIAVKSLSRFEKYTCLFDEYLNKLLNLDSDDKINLTRRGAGLSIMFHKIVANYDKTTRRLLHISLNIILESLSNQDNKYNCLNLNQDSQPARLIHFLRTIVVDKSLHVDLVPYIEKISLICFQNLSSSEWAIRNASLQLLGAVIPQLVGQCSENELNFGTGYSVNHFITHYPILSEFVLQKLKNNSIFNFDGTIVPILTLLSRLSIGGCQFTDYSSQKYINELKKFLRLLFGHPVENVRYLAAKSYAALIPIQKIYSELFNMKIEILEDKSRNFIHGHLLAQICLQQSGSYAGIDVETFPNNLQVRKIIKKCSDLQINRVISMINYWTNNEEIYKKSLCSVIETTFLKNLIILPMLYTDDQLNIQNLIKTFNKILKCKKNKNNTGESEIINYLFKLFFLVIKFINIDYISEYIDRSYISQIISTANENIIYYFMKHLRHELKIQKFQLKNLNKLIFIDKRSRLFELLLSCDYLSKYVFIELVKLIVEIMKYDGKNRNLYLWDSNNKIADKIYKLSKKLLMNDKNKKICQLAHTLNVLCTHHYHKKNKNYLDHCYEIQKKLIDDIVDVVHNGDKEDKIWAIECLFNLSLFQFNHFFQTRIIESLISLLCDEINEIRTMVVEKFRNCEWSTQWDNVNQCWIIVLNKYDDFTICYNDNYYQEYKNYCKLIDKKNFNIQELKSPEIYLYELICVLGSFKYHKCSNEDKLLEKKQNVNNDCDMKCILNTIDYFIKSNENLITNKSSIESPFDHDEIYREDIKILHVFLNCVTSQSFKKDKYKKQYNYKLNVIGYNHLESYISNLTELNDIDINELPIFLDMKSKDYLEHRKKLLYKFIEHLKI